MKEFLTQSAFFGVFLSLITFQIGIYVRKKTKISNISKKQVERPVFLLIR